MGQTLLLALCGLFFACILGLVFGILSVLKNRACNIIATVFVDIIRGVPMIVLAFYVYFAVPMLLNNILHLNTMLGMKGQITFSALQAGTICLALNCGAYMAEIIRAGIQSVDRGQMEAARSLGFGEGQSMRWIVLPQAAKLMIRPLGVNAVALVKGTALVATISVVELTYTAQRFIGSTYKPFEIFAVTAVLYMIMVYGLTLVIDRLDRAYAGEA